MAVTLALAACGVNYVIPNIVNISVPRRIQPLIPLDFFLSHPDGRLQPSHVTRSMIRNNPQPERIALDPSHAAKSELLSVEIRPASDHDGYCVRPYLLVA